MTVLGCYIVWVHSDHTRSDDSIGVYIVLVHLDHTRSDDSIGVYIVHGDRERGQCFLYYGLLYHDYCIAGRCMQ